MLIISHNKEKFYEMQRECQQYGVLLHMVENIKAAIKELLRSQNYLLVLFFLNDLDIIEHLKKIRKITKTPILVVRNHYNSREKIDAIKAGADEYIELPKTVEESIASCHALIRRYTELNHSKSMDDISYGNLTISLYYHKVFIDGHELEFPRREFDLLYLLVSSPGRVFTFQQLAQEVWGDDYEPTENSLHSCVRRIRRKLESVPGNFCRIENIRGVGYCFKENQISGSV